MWVGIVTLYTWICSMRTPTCVHWLDCGRQTLYISSTIRLKLDVHPASGRVQLVAGQVIASIQKFIGRVRPIRHLQKRLLFYECKRYIYTVICVVCCFTSFWVYSWHVVNRGHKNFVHFVKLTVSRINIREQLLF